ncbi:MAG: glycosyltransferase family 4 protein [Thermodesulfobacteriota bacterium]
MCRKTPYTILYLHHTGRFAGAENSLLHLVTHLDRSLFYPVFMCPSAGDFPMRLRERGISVMHHEFGSNSQVLHLIRTLVHLRRVVRVRRIALLHANGPQTNIPAGIMGRWLGIPVIWHARNCLRPGMVDIDRYTGWLPDRIICNSEAVRSRFVGGRVEGKTVTILNGVDLTDYDPGISGDAVRDRWGIPRAAKVVGIIGRLGHEKGHRTLIHALGRLKQEFPDLWLLIVGGHVFDEDRGLPDSLKKTAKDLGLEGRVIFTGHQDDVRPFYAALDLFVLATDLEACGRVLFEAMAMAKPVIGTDNGGTPEIVVEGETGLLFPYGDAKGLSGRISRLLERPAEITRMGASGRRRVEGHFTIERYMEKTQKVYLELLERNRAPRR